jgi:hypothetical protein
MSGDLRTVLWREWRSITSGRARRQLLSTGAVLAIWRSCSRSRWVPTG